VRTSAENPRVGGSIPPLATIHQFLSLGTTGSTIAMHRVLFIREEWDDETNVWIATSDDVPGLAAEADTLEGFSKKLERLVPELFTENGSPNSAEIAYELLARRFSVTHAKAAH